MVPLSSLQIPRVCRYSVQTSLSQFRLQDSHLLRSAFPHRSTTKIMICVCPAVFLLAVRPLPISLATTLGISFDFFSSPYLDVSVREVPLLNLCIQLRIHSSSLWGFPHSEIRGSMDISSSPRLIAGYRVLHRLSVPRHSPYALFRLNSRFAFLHNFFTETIQLLLLELRK